MLLAACDFSARADYQSTVLSQNPVGYWRLNETSPPPPQPILATNVGSLGASLNAPLLNGVVRGQPGALTGTADTSERFSNPNWDITTVGPYANVHYTPELNPNGPFTVEFWAKPTSTPPDVFSPVCSLDTSTNSGASREGYVFYIDGPDSGWQFRLGNYSGYAAIATGGTFTPNTWSYVVGSFTGSSLLLYVNGEQVATTNFNASAYTPNRTQPFYIGMTTFPNRPFDGWIEEVAFYTNVLDAATIKAHFDAASTNGAGYAAEILADNPLGYWRLGEPADPAAVNLGSLGAAADGGYISPAVPGVAGPQAPDFAGFEPDNHALDLPGYGGYVTVPALNLNTNTVTITGWVKAAGPQVPSAEIVFNRWITTTAGLVMDAAGGFGLTYNWNNDPATFNWASGLSLPDSDWAFVALVVQPSQAALFVASDTNYASFAGATNFVSHAMQGFDGVTLFGTDFAYTDRNFAGALDEIAIFNRTLSAGEVFSQYAAALAGVPPQIFAGPQAPTNTLFTGDSLVLSVDAGGSAELLYQWRKDGGDIAGATNNQYVQPRIDATDSGSYDVVVSNSFGFAASSPALLQVSSLVVPSIVQDPVGRVLYPGGTLTLMVSALGGTLDYQWQKDGQPLAGATNSAYSVPAVASADGGAYFVIASNQLGSATSAVATVTVLAPIPGSFEAALVADGPEAWWRLDEPSGATVMVDAMGRHDGMYNSAVTLGMPGAVAGDSGTAASFNGTGYATVPYSPALNGAALTLECWAKTTALRQTMSPVSSHYLGRGCYFVTAAPGSGQWAAAAAAAGSEYFLPSTAPAATMEPDVWTHLVLTFDPTNLLRFYVDGQWDGASYFDFDHNAAGPFVLGGRGISSTVAADLLWNGEVDEVAFYNRALSSDQVRAHYAAARYGTNTAPVFKAQPQSQSAETGTTLSLRSRVEGTLPLALQWVKDGVAITGATNETLTLSNLSYADAGGYWLTATNSAGAGASSTASLLVMPPPGFGNLTNGLVLHLKFDNDFTDASGLGHDAVSNGAPAFIPGHIGPGAIQVSTVTAVSNYNYVSLPYTPDLVFAETDSFSVSFWINYTNTPDDLPMIGNAVGSTLQPGWVFADDKGKLAWTLVGTNGGSVLATPLGGPALNDGAWHSVVASFDRSVGAANTYIDGALAASRSIAGLASLDSGKAVCLGQDPTGTYAVDGVFAMDDLGIWRRALGTYDAQAIYQLGQSAGASFDTYGPVTLAQIPAGSGFELIWQAGTLLEADAIGGPWTPVAGAAPPLYSVSPGPGNKFFRVQL